MEVSDSATGSALKAGGPVDAMRARDGERERAGTEQASGDEPRRDALAPEIEEQTEAFERPVPLATERPRPENTVVVAGGLSESSRLATRFAPIPDPVLVTLFPEPGLRVEIEQEATTRVGRDPRYNDLVLVSPSVSGRHCELIVDDDECSLVDLNSSNGTFVNGGRLTGPRLLKQGDLITIGRYVFMFVWYRFARPPQPEILTYRDLKQVLVKLYPTTAAMRRLLLATGLRGDELDTAEVSSDQAWSRLIERFRKQDVVGALDAILRYAMREHPGNRELERAKLTLDNWRHARKVPGLQERINTDARNSARVVREILVTHLESEGDSDSISEMLDEVTEEVPLVDAVSSQAPVVSSRGSADLPFEVPEDSLVTPPWVSGSAKKTASKMDGSMDEQKRSMHTGPAARLEEQPELPALTSLAPVLEEELRAEDQGGMSTSATVAVVSDAGKPDEGASSSDTVRKDAGTTDGEPGERPAMVEVLDDKVPAQALPPLKDLEETFAPSAKPGAGDEDIGAFVSQVRGRSRRRLLAGAGIAAGLLVAAAVWKLGPSQSEDAATGATNETSRPVQVAQAPGSGAVEPSAFHTSGGDSSAVPPGAEGQASGEREAGQASQPAGNPHRGASVEGKAATVASAGPLPEADDIPVVPQFRVINFLDDDGQPAYDPATFSASGVLDAETSQLLGSALKDCVWVDGRRKKLASKRSRLFLYIRCVAGDKPVEGWVYNRAMKRK